MSSLWSMKIFKLITLLAVFAILLLIWWWIYIAITEDVMEVHRTHFGYPF